MENKQKKQYKLVGFAPYKSGNGKALFVNVSGNGNIVGFACDVLFLGGENHEKITEDAVGREIEPKFGYNKEKKEYYVYDVNVK